MQVAYSMLKYEFDATQMEKTVISMPKIIFCSQNYELMKGKF